MRYAWARKSRRWRPARAIRLGAEVATLASGSSDPPQPIAQALHAVGESRDSFIEGIEHSTTTLLEALADTQRRSP